MVSVDVTPLVSFLPTLCASQILPCSCVLDVALINDLAVVGLRGLAERLYEDKAMLATLLQKANQFGR